nr:small integral membrane protein 24 [Misgurnus anguillicaudatus]
MFHLKNIIAFILLSVSICQAKIGGHRASDTTTTKVTVQPWFIGLAAVVGFLFIVFVLLIAKRLFSKKDKDEMEGKKTEDVNFYENKAVDLEADETKQTTF